MIDIGLSKLALIGVVALVVIGPEKLPRVARTIGTLLGKAQRYVSDVKAEVSRSMELEELRKLQTTMQDAAKGVEQTIHNAASDLEKDWSDVTRAEDSASVMDALNATIVPAYKHPGKNWRLKRGATPQWFKARAGVRTKALSGAARVARYRPRKFHG